jgi:glyoxylase-like metal-dependent hydrolase (beta-lactamase superfamily II)
VVVVDTKNPGWGQPILDAIKKLTDKPVITIINTHTHGDHVSGNVEFPATVDVIVQENTKKLHGANRRRVRVADSGAGEHLQEE